MRNHRLLLWTLSALAAGLAICVVNAQETTVVATEAQPAETDSATKTPEEPPAAPGKPATPAAGPATPAAPATPATAEDVEVPIERKLRDPFWPINYQPKTATVPVKPGDPKPRPVDITPDWVKAEKQLNISGVVIDRTGKKEPFAIVNGNVITVDDVLTMESRKFIYIWTVKGITKEDGLQLTRKRAKQKDK